MGEVQFLVFKVHDVTLGTPPSQVQWVLPMGKQVDGKDIRSLAEALGIPGDGRGGVLLGPSQGNIDWEVEWVSGMLNLHLNSIYPIPQLLKNRVHPALQGIAVIDGGEIVWLLDVTMLGR